MKREFKTPKVTLLSHTADPLPLVYSLWQASKNEDKLMTVEDVKRDVPDGEVRELFRRVIDQKIPIGEHVDFVFMIENVSVSWREQAVRHRIGTKVSPERVGADLVMDEMPDLADSSWWSQCFTGDTKLRLLDGTEPTLEELAERGGEFWVYSATAEGEIVPGRGHSARLTKRSKLVEVELDNGEKIRCTPDHLWMLRSGEYREARDLAGGESLMPLYRKLDDYGYEMSLDQRSRKWLYTHRLVDEYLNGPFADNEVVHHSSFDKRNNDPRALRRMDKLDHVSLHSALVVERMKNDPEAHSVALSAGQKRHWDGLSEGERDVWRERASVARLSINLGKRNAAAKKEMDGRWAEPAWKEKMLPTLADNGRKSKGSRRTPEQRARQSASAKRRFRVQKETGSLPANFNHKVVSVRELEETADVYDITVDEHYNFALASGVFVHNSMRIQDMSTFAERRNYRVPQTILDHKDGDLLLETYTAAMDAAEGAYSALVNSGIPMEDARELIPLGAQHRISWKLNIGALQHIVGKRGCWILQLGIWGPVIKGMVEELVKKVDPIFSELVTPPCIKENKFSGCVYHEENRRRYTGDDKLPVCSLHLRNHGCEGEGFAPIDEFGRSSGKQPPMMLEMANRAEEYREFWQRDPYTGEREVHRLKIIQ